MGGHQKHGILVNDRIHVSAFRPEDSSDLARCLNNKKIHDRTLRIPFPYGEADAQTFLEFSAKAEREYGHPVHFAVRDQRGAAIGGFGFESLSHGHRAEIGYWLAVPFWGQGIMTAVAGALCGHAARQWKLVRITAHVFAGNGASASVLVKNGFQCEGLLRKHYLKNGTFLDARLFARVG